MTEPPFDEHGDRLRRALQAEAEAVTADPDGLERIRARINKRERQFGWLTVPWLRPLAAAGAAVFIAAAAVTATPAIEGIVSTGHDSPSAQGGNDQSLAINGPGASNRLGLPLSTTIGPDGIPRTAARPVQGVPVRGKPGRPGPDHGAGQNPQGGPLRVALDERLQARPRLADPACRGQHPARHATAAVLPAAQHAPLRSRHPINPHDHPRQSSRPPGRSSG